MYVENPIQLAVGQTSGQTTINIPSAASYVGVINNTTANVSFAVGTLPPGPNAVTVSAGKTYSGQMQTTQIVTIAWTSQEPITADNNTVLFSFSDQPITLNMSNTSVTEVTGTVEATISGNPTFQLASGATVDANIQGTPTFQLASGAAVDATIQGTPIFELASGATIDANITNASIPVTGTVNANIQNAELTVTGNVGITGTANVQVQGTTEVEIIGTPTVNFAEGQVMSVQNASGGALTVAGQIDANLTGGTVQVSSGSVQITNAVQTNNLVTLGTWQIPVVDLANANSITQLCLGDALGYWQNIILQGTSQKGYTYSVTASAYNGQVNVGTPSSGNASQSNGGGGQFYYKGTLSSYEAFNNVQINLTADDTENATIFSDAMTSGTNWTTQSGSATYGSTGATFGANGTILTETEVTALPPQNLTLAASYAVSNAQTMTTVNGPYTSAGLVNISVAANTCGGARKLVQLSNGWWVYAVWLTTNDVVFLVSENNGTSWSKLCTLTGYVDSPWNIAISSSGTTVYVLWQSISDANVYFTSFNATTVSGSVSSTATVMASTEGGQGLAIEYCPSSGILYAAVNCTISGYAGSNLTILWSSNGGSSWSSVVQTEDNNSSDAYRWPAIAITSKGYVYVFYSYYYNSGESYGLDYYFSTNPTSTSWTNEGYCAGMSYGCCFPTVAVDVNDNLYLAFEYDDNIAFNYGSASAGSAISWQNSTGSTPTYVYSPGYMIYGPSISVDINGYLTIIFSVGTSSGHYYFGQIYNSAPTGTWTFRDLTSESPVDNDYVCEAYYRPGNWLDTALGSSPIIFCDINQNQIFFEGEYLTGNHSTIGIMYWGAPNTYYLFEWSGLYIYIYKCVNGTTSLIAKKPLIDLNATNPSLQLVIASTGAITGTMKGTNTTTITTTDTSVNSGVIGVTGDAGVVASNASMSGYYIPSDTVTVTAYAV